MPMLPGSLDTRRAPATVSPIDVRPSVRSWPGAIGLLALCTTALVGCASTAQTEALEKRVAALEAQVRDLKVNSISLVDKDGKTHASFAMRDEDGTPQLLMQDAEGRNRLLARLHPDGTPILVLWGKDGKGTSYLSVPGEGPPQLMFFDKDGGQPVKLP